MLHFQFNSFVFCIAVEQNVSTLSASSTITPAASPVIETQASTVAATETIGATSSSVAEKSLTWESIPEPPSIPNPIEELTTLVLSSNGEPTLASLGLGGWSPSGIVQQCLEFAHVSIGLPWWSSIMLGKNYKIAS